MILLINNSVINAHDNNETLKSVIELRAALRRLKIPFHEVKKVEIIDKIKSKIKGIIISGSQMKLSNPDLEFSEYAYNLYYLNELDVPVLGICFGCQLLNIIYGGSVKDMKKYFSDDALTYLSTCPLFASITGKEFKYNFSDLIIPNKMKIGNMKAEEIGWFRMNGRKYSAAFEFEKGKIFGLLFHPEMHEWSQHIFANFYDICLHLRTLHAL